MSPSRSRARVSVVALAMVSALGLASCHHDEPLPGAPPAGSPSGEGEAAGVRYIERITGGASASDTLPLVVGIHGRGGRPERFAAALATLNVRARLIFPYGLHRHGTGFAWFDAETEADFATGTKAAAERLAPMIAEIAKQKPTSGRAIVTGLSQGGSLAYTLAVLHPELVWAAFPVSSSLARSLIPDPWPAHSVMPRIHAMHGTADDTVPIGFDRDTVARLKATGFRIELTEYEGVGHQMTREMQEALARAVGQACSE